MTSVLVTTSSSHPVRVDLVAAALPEDWEVVTHEFDTEGIDGGSPAELADAVQGHDALLLRPGRATRAVFERAESLRVLAVHGSGYGRVDLTAATAADVVVTHSPEAPAPAVVEHTVCTMLTLLRDLPKIHEQTTAGKWSEAKRPWQELGQTTVGIVGLGTIGFEVARKARAFDATVLGYDPYVDETREPTAIYPRTDRETVESAGVELVGLDELLTRSTVVSLHTPLTEDTSHMIGAAELEKLGNGYLLNAARGGIVDEEALVQAVESETIAGAALDVMQQEPPDPDHPLLASDDVLVTPHIAGVTDGYLDRAAQFGSEKIRAALSGDCPDGVLNPDVFD